jgi:hypothetical protein
MDAIEAIHPPQICSPGPIFVMYPLGIEGWRFNMASAFQV